MNLFLEALFEAVSGADVVACLDPDVVVDVVVRSSSSLSVDHGHHVKLTRLLTSRNALSSSDDVPPRLRAFFASNVGPGIPARLLHTGPHLYRRLYAVSQKVNRFYDNFATC